jgi:hypothetical protein
MVKRVPLGRLGQAEDVAAAIQFLVSPRASYISGANLAVSGAWDWEEGHTFYHEIDDFPRNIPILSWIATCSSCRTGYC